MVSAEVMLMFLVSAGFQFESWKHQFWWPLCSEMLVFCMVFYACDRFGLASNEFFLFILQALLIFFHFFLFLYTLATSSSRKKEKSCVVVLNFERNAILSTPMQRNAGFWNPLPSILLRSTASKPFANESLEQAFPFGSLHLEALVAFGRLNLTKTHCFWLFFFHTKKWTQPDPKLPPNQRQNDPIQMASS